MNWAPLALRIRRQGGDDMMELLRVLPMAAQAYLDEWFESDTLKGALGGSAVIGAALGPRSAGTTLMFLYQSLGGLLAHRFVRGGIGWRHASGDLTPRARLAIDSGDGFVVSGAPLADDATLLEAGIGARLSPNSLLELGYSGQLADEADDYGLSARFSLRF